MIHKPIGLLSVLLFFFKETYGIFQAGAVSTQLTDTTKPRNISAAVFSRNQTSANKIVDSPLHVIGKSDSSADNAFNKLMEKDLKASLPGTSNQVLSSKRDKEQKIPFIPRVIRLQQSAVMPTAISRLFNTFTFKGIGVSTSKSLIKWRSTGIGFKIPLTANFPTYDSIVSLPKIGTSFSLRYPSFDLAWSISLSVPVTVAIQGLVWVGWVMGQVPHHMLEKSRKANASGAVRRVGMTFAMLFNSEKGLRLSYGPWLVYIPERKLLDKILPHLYMLPAIIMAFLDLVLGLHATSAELPRTAAAAAASAGATSTSSAIGTKDASTKRDQSFPLHQHNQGKRKDKSSRGSQLGSKGQVQESHYYRAFDPLAWQAKILAWTRAERRNVVLGGRVGLFRIGGVLMPSVATILECQPFFPFKDAIVAGLERLRNQRNLENAAAMLTMAFQSISKKKAMNSTTTQKEHLPANSRHEHEFQELAYLQREKLRYLDRQEMRHQYQRSQQQQQQPPTFQRHKTRNPKRKVKTVHVHTVHSGHSHNVSCWHSPLNRTASFIDRHRSSPSRLSEDEALRTVLIIAHRHAQHRQLHISPSSSPSSSISVAAAAAAANKRESGTPCPAFPADTDALSTHTHPLDEPSAELRMIMSHDESLQEQSDVPISGGEGALRAATAAGGRVMGSDSAAEENCSQEKRHSSQFTREQQSMQTVPQAVIPRHLHTQQQQLLNTPAASDESGEHVGHQNTVLPNGATDTPSHETKSSISSISSRNESIQLQQVIQYVIEQQHQQRSVRYIYVKQQKKRQPRYSSPIEEPPGDHQRRRRPRLGRRQRREMRSEPCGPVSHWRVPWDRNASSSAGRRGSSGISRLGEVDDEAMQAVLQAVSSQRQAQLGQLHKSPAAVAATGGGGGKSGHESSEMSRAAIPPVNVTHAELQEEFSLSSRDESSRQHDRSKQFNESEETNSTTDPAKQCIKTSVQEMEHSKLVMLLNASLTMSLRRSSLRRHRHAQARRTASLAPAVGPVSHWHIPRNPRNSSAPSGDSWNSGDHPNVAAAAAAALQTVIAQRHAQWRQLRKLSTGSRHESDAMRAALLLNEAAHKAKSHLERIGLSLPSTNGAESMHMLSNTENSVALTNTNDAGTMESLQKPHYYCNPAVCSEVVPLLNPSITDGPAAARRLRPRGSSSGSSRRRGATEDVAVGPLSNWRMPRNSNSSSSSGRRSSLRTRLTRCG